MEGCAATDRSSETGLSGNCTAAATCLGTEMFSGGDRRAVLLTGACKNRKASPASAIVPTQAAEDIICMPVARRMRSWAFRAVLAGMLPQIGASVLFAFQKIEARADPYSMARLRKT